VLCAQPKRKSNLQVSGTFDLQAITIIIATISSPLPLASGRAGDVGDGMSVGTRIPSSRGALRPGCFVFPWY